VIVLDLHSRVDLYAVCGRWAILLAMFSRRALNLPLRSPHLVMFEFSTLGDRFSAAIRAEHILQLGQAALANPFLARDVHFLARYDRR
jgi:hypothetical protein